MKLRSAWPTFYGQVTLIAFNNSWKLIGYADSRRVSCQLLVQEWTLNTGKLPLEGLPRNIVVK